MNMFIEEIVHTRFDTSDITEWIIGKTGYDDKIHMSQYDKRRTPLDIECVQSIYPEVCASTDYDYYIECPGIIVFTKLSDSITSFISKYQFSDKDLQCVMQSNCRTSLFKAALEHLEVHNDVNVYYYDGPTFDDVQINKYNLYQKKKYVFDKVKQQIMMIIN